MKPEDLKARSKKFALDIFKLVEILPKNKVGNVISNQILRSATSVGANYRAACRSRTPKDFVSKITVVEEEADETLYWLELIDESGLNKSDLLTALMKEANELTAIFTATGKTAKAKIKVDS